MKVLVIDILNYVMGVFFIEEENVIGEIIINLIKNYFVCFMLVVEKLLKECGVKLKELIKIVVVVGFGFYIGVCIGVIVVKILVWLF